MADSSDYIAIACDHAGFECKEYIKLNLSKLGYSFKDFGAYSHESVDYPDMIHPLASAINNGEFIKGIILCGSGNGVAMVANKYPGIRTAICWNEEITKLARLHNDANVIALPARFISMEEACKMALLFLRTSFEGGRHQRRIEKINNLL
jgi:ribose 5-phosphate isomerase B